MQTVYYTTNNFVRHTGNVVDLSEYRRKLAAAQSQQVDWQEQEEVAEPAAVAPRPRRSRQRREQRGLMLDMCASMGVLVMTLTFTLHVLCL